MEVLGGERSELGCVVDPGDQRHLKSEVGAQPRTLNNIDAAQLLVEMLVLLGREGAACVRRLASPRHLHLNHRANEAVELGATGGIATLRHLVPVGHFVDHEERPGLLPALDGVRPVALRRDDIRISIWIVVDLGLEVHHDLVRGHDQQLGPRPLVVGREGRLMNMIHQRKEVVGVDGGL